MLFTKATPKNIQENKGIKKIPSKYHANVIQHFNMKQNMFCKKHNY